MRSPTTTTTWMTGCARGCSRSISCARLPSSATSWKRCGSAFPGSLSGGLVHETIRRMVNVLVTDLTCTEPGRTWSPASPGSVDQVRDLPALIDFSPQVARRAAGVEGASCCDNLYRHYRVNRAGTKARRIVRELFEAFHQEPRLPPPDFHEQFQRDGVRAIADYVAGMTDRYAIREHRRLFAVEEG